MPVQFMQGDRYFVPFILRAQDGTIITDEMVKTVVLNLGNMSRQYPGDVTYSDGKWLFPMSQKQSFAMKGSVEPQARIEFNDGTIFGGAGRKIPIVFSINRGIIGAEASEHARLARPVSLEIGNARGNISVTIGAASAGGGGGGSTEGAVRYDIAQKLTEEQQKQARDNIGADVGGYFEIRVTKSGDTYTADKTYNEIKVAIESGLTPVCRMKTQAADAILDDVFYYYNWQIIDGNPDANAFTFNNMSNGVSRFIAIYNSGAVYYFDDRYNFYTLPTATSTTLGGVKPVAKTDAMTRNVGVDGNGGLYTEPAAWYVTVMQTSADSYSASADKTPQEVFNAYQAGYAVYARFAFVNDEHLEMLPLVVATADDGNIFLQFFKTVQLAPGDDPIFIYVFYIYTDWSFGTIQLVDAAHISYRNPLGITGAQVGQIAKITDVDASGKPTKWEPVDMAGGGGPSSALICDVTLAEAVQAVSQTLEHNFYALHCIVNCGTSGVALLVDSDGASASGRINLMLDTTAASFNTRNYGLINYNAAAWKSYAIHAIWSPDRTYFEQSQNEELSVTANATVYRSFGGITAMKGTLGADALSPDSGRTVNIVAPVNTLLNAGVRVIIWGEYYE